MSCILRASGENFDVERFIMDCGIKPIRVWRKGDLRSPKSQPDGKRTENSGANFVVSLAEFSELELQFEDARVFFLKNKAFILGLRDFPGVESIVVDFGAEIHPPGWCWFTFPPDLLVLVGGLGVQLMLSVYPVCDDDET